MFDDLLRIQRGSQQALDLIGRSLYPVAAICCENKDPENLRRIRVSNPSKPAIASDWIQRMSGSPGVDDPLPAIGQTVLCFFVDGSETQGWYLCGLNMTNPPLKKEDSIKDSYREVKGDRSLQVQGWVMERSEEDHTISVKEDVILKNDKGSEIHIYQGGAIRISAFNIDITVGGLSGGLGRETDLEIYAESKVTLDLNGQELQILNTSDVKIGSKSVATVGALDSSGDVLITRGW